MPMEILGLQEEKYYIASHAQLMWRRFKRHKLAIAGMVVLVVFYFVSVFAEFFSTYDIYQRHARNIYCPPQRIHFFDAGGKFHIRPFVYELTRKVDPETFRNIYTENTEKKYRIAFFLKTEKYKLWDSFELDVRFFGVEQGGTIFLFGTDALGRDQYSRSIHGARISLSIGLFGVALSFILGCVLGGISGYYGGKTDMIIQRIIEFLVALPTVPLWMALSAALPPHWSSIKVYFAITIILSIFGWCGLARVVRGKLLELREADFVVAALMSNATEVQIIGKHLLPSFMSYLIVNLTLAVPRMILGETALSFLGLGLRPPVVSWGVLLKEAQNIRTVALHPWLLIPGLLVVVVVLAFNFVGDGLRDAADPYRQ